MFLRRTAATGEADDEHEDTDKDHSNGCISPSTADNSYLYIGLALNLFGSKAQPQGGGGGIIKDIGSEERGKTVNMCPMFANKKTMQATIIPQ